MKLTTFILIISLLQVTAATFGQNVTLKQSNVSIAKLFYEIRKQTGYDVLIKGNQLETKQLINANFSNAPLTQVMDQVVAGTDLVYVIEHKTVVIKEKGTPLKGLQNPTLAIINAWGKIFDEKGAPLAGATLVIKGSTTVTKTNAKGEFVLFNLADDAVLVISYVGYKTLEMSLKGVQMPVSIKLKMLAGQLDDVQVVSTGYQTLAKAHVTGSYSTLGSKELEKSATFDLSSALEGRMPGVVRGPANTIVIRGTGTLLQNGQNQPLFVIDGFPVEGELFTISNSIMSYSTPALNPDNIESITVLKDAAAAAIYGAKAGNGVIVITTKKAKTGTAQITASSDIQVTPRNNHDYMKYMPASKYLDLQWNYVDRNPRLQNPAQRMAEINNLRNTYTVPSPSLDLMLKYYDGSLTRDAAETAINKLRSNDVPLLDDLDKYVYRPIITQRYFLSVGKATEGSNTMATFTFTKNQGNVLNNNGNALDVNLRNSLDFSKWISMDVQAYMRYGKEQSSLSAATLLPVSAYPYTRLFDSGGNAIPYYDQFIYPTQLKIVDQYPNDLMPMGISLIDELNRNIDHTKNFMARGAVTLNFNLTKWLKFSSGFQYERSQVNSDLIYDKESYAMRKMFNDNTALTPSGAITHRIPYADSRSTTYRNTENYTWRNQLSFNHTSADGLHSVNALAGTETRQIAGRHEFNRVFGYDRDLLTWTNLNNKDMENFFISMMGSYAFFGIYDFHSEAESKNRFLSYYGNTGYTFMGRYNVSGSIRWDKSNFFGTNPKYQNKPLWSAGVSWNMQEEAFIKDIKWIDQLKLRATYGLNGNIARDVSPYLIASYTFPNTVTGRPYGRIQSPPNAGLRWEKVKVTNIGLDFSLLNQRLFGSFERYSRNSSDLLINTELESTYGFSNLKLNAGDMSNKGVELNLQAVLIRKSDFRWNLGFVLGYNKNKITRSFVKPTYASSIVSSGTGYEILQGYPLNSLWSYKFAGINENGDPQVYDEKGEKIWNRDMNNLDGLVYSGSLTPLYSGGINTTLNWKGFELMANFIYNAGHKMRKLTVAPNLYSMQGPTNLMYDGYNNV